MNNPIKQSDFSIVKSYYDESAQNEWERLDRHRNEYAVTLRALKDHLPIPPASILDLGGGPGRYSIALTQRGYDVSLADLSEGNLAMAKMKAAEAGVMLADMQLANALDLHQFSDDHFDAVLLMGPLYHLTLLEERQKAVSEALRVLKPGGILAATFISRFALFRDGISKDPAWIFRDVEYAWHLLRTGIHDNGIGFTRSYFAHPTEVEPLFQPFDLDKIALIGVEGVAAENEALVNQLPEDQWEVWVEFNYTLACDVYALGCADHLMYIGRKR